MSDPYLDSGRDRKKEEKQKTMRQSASKGLYTCTWAYSALTSTRGRENFSCKGHLSKTPGRKVSESQGHQEGLICSQKSAQGPPSERNNVSGHREETCRWRRGRNQLSRDLFFQCLHRLIHFKIQAKHFLTSLAGSPHSPQQDMILFPVLLSQPGQKPR